MNNLLLIVVAVVGLIYFGGPNVPSVLRRNKEMLLGVVVGLIIGPFMGVGLEGFGQEDYRNCMYEAQEIIDSCNAQWSSSHPSETEGPNTASVSEGSQAQAPAQDTPYASEGEAQAAAMFVPKPTIKPKPLNPLNPLKPTQPMI